MCLILNMRTLDEIIEAHEKWLYLQEGGTRADLRGANLIGADLRRADLDIPFTPDPDLLKKIAHLVLVVNGENKLKMDNWHTCETTHCLAGWGDRPAEREMRCQTNQKDHAHTVK